MRKLKLNLEALQVETFAAQRAPEPRGTVQGHYTSGPIACQGTCLASHQCSGGQCSTLVGCGSYENTCACALDFC